MTDHLYRWCHFACLDDTITCGRAKTSRSCKCNKKSPPLESDALSIQQCGSFDSAAAAAAAGSISACVCMCICIYMSVPCVLSFIPATQTATRVHVRECCASAMTQVCISCYAPEDKARVAVSNICEMATREPSLSCSFKFRQCCFMRHEIPALVVIHKTPHALLARYYYYQLIIPIFFFIHCLLRRCKS